MVSRGYEAPIAGKPNWITGQPNWWLGVAWAAILVGATLLTLQTAAYILQTGLVAARPPLMAVVAAGSSALFGFGMRSPLLAAVRLLSHLALYALATVVAWRARVAMRRETHAEW